MANSTETAMLAEKRGITGSTLKMLAMITMLIDHIGAIILERMAFKDYIAAMQQGTLAGFDYHTMDLGLVMLYQVFRFVGRLGFPIFCFLLIEGFMHTRNVKKYAGRLFLFALISEVPFDLGFTGTPFFMGYQNVFFTLFIGLSVMIAFRWIEEKEDWKRGLRFLLSVLALAAGMGVAYLLQSDYDWIGVLTIAVMYRFRYKRMLSAGLGCTVLTLTMPIEITAFLALIPIRMYNGRRGWNIKWLFYAFYPLHILLLYLIGYFMNLGPFMLTLM